MSTEDQIVNRVSSSPLVTFDLENFYSPGERVLLDIKDQLFQGLILREKDFRDFIRNHQWSDYQGKFVAITCSVDAIVPTWAFMLVAIALQPFAKKIVFGSISDLETELFRDKISDVNWSDFSGAKVVIKGCSKIEVPVALYVDVVAGLKPHAASLMFGEPCSTVPLYKRKASEKE